MTICLFTQCSNRYLIFYQVSTNSLITNRKNIAPIASNTKAKIAKTLKTCFNISFILSKLNGGIYYNGN